MLSSQLVRNNLSESQIEAATVIQINRKSESVLIRVEDYHPVKYKSYTWFMLSYDTGQHSIMTFDEDPCERVLVHWEGFKENALKKHEDLLKRLANSQY